MEDQIPDEARQQRSVVEPHYSLDDAARKFFPSGNVTSRSLRTEIAKGFLLAIKVAGKLCVSEGAIKEMLERKWQDDRRVRGYISGVVVEIDVPTGKSEMDRRRSAQAAALMTLKERSTLSRVI
jgi:hypothetical protein